MVDIHFDGGEETITCEGCGTELPVFLNECPYCMDDDDAEYEETEMPCPACGAMIYDDSVRCAVCGAYVTMKVNGGQNRPFVILVVVLLVVAMLLWVSVV